ncbi:hypothetical protein IV203_020064 [Nitzschia inconspicua]|uniref:Uncharacterized protein n=1 Tax=Nitzschia inconspicua TaxID=303405 RepID=A0A9K3LZW9_9STRA|nr:hypothetical protein IV203_020064 [Nitzschia inconspicua]
MNRFGAINNEACSLLDSAEYGTAVGLFKEALTVLQTEISGSDSNIELFSERTKLCVPRIQNSSTSFYFHQQTEHFGPWIYAQPLRISPDESDVSNSHVFAVTFNMALACHLLATEFEDDSVGNDARQYFIKAKKLYQLPLKLIQESTSNFTSLMEEDLFLFAAVLNNISHVHSSLEEIECMMVYRHQLVKTLFFFIDAGVISHDRTFAFDCFLVNVQDIVCRIYTAGAA